MGALIETERLLLISHLTGRVTLLGPSQSWRNPHTIRRLLADSSSGGARRSWPADRLLSEPRSGRRGCAAHLHQANRRRHSGNSWRTWPRLLPKILVGSV